jgi:hypothetical protein
VQSWDTANKATELSDFSVCTTRGIEGKDPYLLNLLRRRLGYPALKRAAREQQSLFNATVVVIEDKASGTQLIQELIADGCHAVTRYQPECDKTMRMHARDRDDRERLCPPPRGRPLARREVWREKTGAPRTAFAAHTYNEADPSARHHPRLIRPVEQVFGGQLYMHQYKINCQGRVRGRCPAVAPGLRHLGAR